MPTRTVRYVRGHLILRMLLQLDQGYPLNLFVTVRDSAHVAVGSGRLLENGQQVPIDLKAGGRVLFPKYSGSEVKIDGVVYLIMRESDVLGVIQ